MDRHNPFHRPGTLALCAVLALAACDEIGIGGESAAPAATGTGDAAPVVRMQERDVERPDIYEITARALWDGRFSFGDRWVAVADDVKAERVRITNTESGRSIEGALFQKEPGLPGPPIMVSQNAAEALGMTAGQPATLEVVVLRREMVQMPAPGAPAAAAPADADGPRLSVGTVETEALPGTLPSAAPAPEPAAEEPAEAAAPAAGDGLSVGTVTTSALAPAADGAEDEAEAEAPAAPDTAAAGSARRFQVAAGTNREGAEAALRRVKDAGLPGEVTEAESQGATVYRVIAGPFEDAAAAQSALATLRELGYADAFAVR